MFAEDSSQDFLFSAMKQMFVRASVVLGKRFEHNLATEEDCVLHCGSLMPAAAALIHPSDHVPCVLGPCTTCQSAGCQQPLPLQVG